MSTSSNDTMRWFRPPRAHGDVIEDRTVSFLELFYDLVFVVLIAQIAHTLAEDVSWAGVGGFALVFALVWIAWFNGTLYHDLHGGDDGRSRTYIFIQMMLLVPLSGFAGHATSDADDGRGFAIVYTLLLLQIAWQWYDVRRFDTEEWRTAAAPYVLGMAGVATIVFASVFVGDPQTRILTWTAAVGMVALINVAAVIRPESSEMLEAIHPSDSLVERFGLFTIIVLGEVVVGVANGLSEISHTLLPIITGLLALNIGFAFWWNYFDLVSGRRPRRGRAPIVWVAAHLALAMCISAAGAGMVSLVEHAADGRTPAPTAWLITGATAGVALSIAALSRTIDPHPARRMAPSTLVAAAAGALAIGATRPAPWLLALALWALLSAVWFEAFARHRRHGLSIADRV